MEEELVCPISKDWLDDPITVPCCCRSFSRQSLIHSFDHNGETCPWCRQTLSHYDPHITPKNTVLANLVELAIIKQTASDSTLTQLFTDTEETHSDPWTAKLHVLTKD